MKLNELDKILSTLEAQFGNDFVRRVVPSNKGVKCLTTGHQILYRQVVPLNGEHELSIADQNLVSDKNFVEALIARDPKKMDGKILLDPNE